MTEHIGFSRYERLKSRKLIEHLFREGKAMHVPPLRVIYLPCEQLHYHQVLFAVSKKKVRRAVMRNKLKRRIREAYRLHKYLLSKAPPPYFLIGYVYIGGSELYHFKTIQEKVITSLQRLNKLSQAPKNNDPS